MLYEFFVVRKSDAGWQAAQASVFDLKTNQLRPDGARPNLTAGPETRYYVGQFLRRDTLLGELSDVLVVTVPGVA